MVFTTPASVVAALGYGLDDQHKLNLETPLALPETPDYGIRAASVVFSSEVIEKKTSGLYSLPTGSKIQVLHTFAQFERKDEGRRMIAICGADFSRNKGGARGAYVLGEYLPLKEARSGYKKESGLQYVEAKHISKLTTSPIWKTADLEGYMKGLRLFTDLGIKSLQDYKAFVANDFTAKVTCCNDAAKVRIERFISTNCPQTQGMAATARSKQLAEVEVHYLRVGKLKTAMANSFETRFQIGQETPAAAGAGQEAESGEVPRADESAPSHAAKSAPAIAPAVRTLGQMPALKASAAPAVPAAPAAPAKSANGPSWRTQNVRNISGRGAQLAVGVLTAKKAPLPARKGAERADEFEQESLDDIDFSVGLSGLPQRLHTHKSSESVRPPIDHSLIINTPRERVTPSDDQSKNSAPQQPSTKKKAGTAATSFAPKTTNVDYVSDAAESNDNKPPAKARKLRGKYNTAAMKNEEATKQLMAKMELMEQRLLLITTQAQAGPAASSMMPAADLVLASKLQQAQAEVVELKSAVSQLKEDLEEAHTASSECLTNAQEAQRNLDVANTELETVTAELNEAQSANKGEYERGYGFGFKEGYNAASK